MAFLYAASRLRWIAGSDGPAKLILITRAPFTAAQSSPLRILKVEPSPLALADSKARTARMRAAGAEPISLAWATMRPAIAVPWLLGFPDPSIASKLAAM